MGTDGSLQQCAGFDAQRFGQLFNDGDRRIARAALQVADVGPMDAGLMRELLLRPVLFLAQPTQVAAEVFANVHARRSAGCRPSIYRRSVTFRLTSPLQPSAIACH
jgi:hypothetical protein